MHESAGLSLHRSRQTFVFFNVIPRRSSFGSSSQRAFHAGSSLGVISHSTICGIPFKLQNSNSKELEEAEKKYPCVYRANVWEKKTPAKNPNWLNVDIYINEPFFIVYSLFIVAITWWSFQSQKCAQTLRIIVPSCLMKCVMTSILVHQSQSNANCIKAIISTPVKWCDWQLHGSLTPCWMEKETGTAANHFVSFTFIMSQRNIGVLLNEISWPHSLIQGKASFCVSIYTSCRWKCDKNGSSRFNLCSRT